MKKTVLSIKCAAVVHARRAKTRPTWTAGAHDCDPSTIPRRLGTGRVRAEVQKYPCQPYGKAVIATQEMSDG